MAPFEIISDISAAEGRSSMPCSLPYLKIPTLFPSGENIWYYSPLCIDAIGQNQNLYQLFITCKNGKYDIEMTRISVWCGKCQLAGEEKNLMQRNGLWADSILNHGNQDKLSSICMKLKRLT